MRIHPAFAVCVTLALGCLGCPSVAHVELADGTIVSFVQPERGGEEKRHGKNAEGRFVTTVRMDCTATREVGLAGEVLVRSAQRRDEEGYFHRDDSSTFRLTNVSDKPIALKRFLAYSSISQAGYILLGVISGNELGMTSLVYYILVYMISTLAIFGVIGIIEPRTAKITITDHTAL